MYLPIYVRRYKKKIWTVVSRDCLFEIEDVYVKHINLKNKYELTVIFH